MLVNNSMMNIVKIWIKDDRRNVLLGHFTGAMDRQQSEAKCINVSVMERDAMTSRLRQHARCTDERMKDCCCLRGTFDSLIGVKHQYEGAYYMQKQIVEQYILIYKIICY